MFELFLTKKLFIFNPENSFINLEKPKINQHKNTRIFYVENHPHNVQM